MKNFLKLTDDFQNEEKIILRDHLALERTKLANERTLFSYIRTSLYLATVGVGILQIDSVTHLQTLAWISLSVSILILGTGFLRFFQLKKHLHSYTIPLKGNEPTEEQP